jgi:alpha-glucosidase (family GH31 glycosyl hydrolase)
VRDLQWKAFTPALMTMSGWATPAYKQPWTYGEPYTAINRKHLKLRERLLPYFSSYAAKAHRTGDRLTVDVYPEGKSSFSLYEDDRVTRNYKENKSATQQFEVGVPTTGRGDVTLDGRKLTKLVSKNAYLAAPRSPFRAPSSPGRPALPVRRTW